MDMDVLDMAMDILDPECPDLLASTNGNVVELLEKAACISITPTYDTRDVNFAEKITRSRSVPRRRVVSDHATTSVSGVVLPTTPDRRAYDAEEAQNLQMYAESEARLRGEREKAAREEAMFQQVCAEVGSEARKRREREEEAERQDALFQQVCAEVEARKKEQEAAAMSSKQPTHARSEEERAGGGGVRAGGGGGGAGHTGRRADGCEGEAAIEWTTEPGQTRCGNAGGTKEMIPASCATRATCWRS